MNKPILSEMFLIFSQLYFNLICPLFYALKTFLCVYKLHPSSKGVCDIKTLRRWTQRELRERGGGEPGASEADPASGSSLTRGLPHKSDKGLYCEEASGRWKGTQRHIMAAFPKPDCC